MSYQPLADYRLSRSLGLSRRRSAYSALPTRIQAMHSLVRGHTVVYRAKLGIDPILTLDGPAFVAESSFTGDRWPDIAKGMTAQKRHAGRERWADQARPLRSSDRPQPVDSWERNVALALGAAAFLLAIAAVAQLLSPVVPA